MLNLNYLLEEAKNNGLPIQKQRGVLREYLQTITLASIYKHNLGKLVFFTGGTALRFFYNLPRFSEDLDFDTATLNYEQFKEILDYVKKGLINEGFILELLSNRRNNLYQAEIHFTDLMKTYNITDQRGIDLMIKIEVLKPSWDLQNESSVMSLYGYNFSSTLLHQGHMFAEKLCALFNRNRGRDIYDTLFMLKNRFPINTDVLTANNIKGNAKELILKHLHNLTQKELIQLANQVKPFLFKEDDIELILKAPLFADKFLRFY